MNVQLLISIPLTLNPWILLPSLNMPLGLECFTSSSEKCYGDSSCQKLYAFITSLTLRQDQFLLPFNSCLFSILKIQRCSSLLSGFHERIQCLSLSFFLFPSCACVIHTLDFKALLHVSLGQSFFPLLLNSNCSSLANRLFRISHISFVPKYKTDFSGIQITFLFFLEAR